MASDSSPLLSVNAVADRLRVEPQAVRGWIRSGALEAVRLGSGPRARLRVSEAALAAFCIPVERKTPS